MIDVLCGRMGEKHNWKELININELENLVKRI